MAEKKTPRRGRTNARPEEAPSEEGPYEEGPSSEFVEAPELRGMFLDRHFGGGEAASPEVLDRASRLWRRLPGAVSRPPGGITPEPRPGGPADEEVGQ